MRRQSSQRGARPRDFFDGPSMARDDKVRHPDDEDCLSLPGEEFYAATRDLRVRTHLVANENQENDSRDHHDHHDHHAHHAHHDHHDRHDGLYDGFAARRLYRGRAPTQGDDSPTLGRPLPSQAKLSILNLSPSGPSDPLPSSALTADTDGTMFDNEPQDQPPASRSGNRTMLSQIMDMRRFSLGPSPTPSETGSEQADKESVQIMLRNTTYYDDDDLPPPRPTPPPDNHRAQLHEDNLDHWSTSSWTSSIRARASPEPPSDVEVTPETPPNSRGQPRSRSPFATPRLDRSGILRSSSAAPSDAYGSIYQSPDHPTRAGVGAGAGAGRQHLFGEIYQKILDQSPDLARQGGWDTQRVTQLCLQEIDRGKYERLSKVSSPRKADLDSARRSPASADSAISRTKKLVQGHKYRASLNNAEDFAFTSPSIVDWMQFAAADNSPTEERGELSQPFPPHAPASSTARQGPTTPKGGRSEASGVGLNIQLRSPLKSPMSRTSPQRTTPPPFPAHSPPPLPNLNRSLTDTPPLLGPSIYENGRPSSGSAQQPFSRQSPQLSYKVNRLSRMPSRPGSTEALVASSQDSVSALTNSFLANHLGLEQASAQNAVGPPASLLPDQKKIVRRKHVIKELVDTEVSFGRDMSVVDDIYKGTTSSCTELTADDIKVLFGNSVHVVKFSMDFLDSLKKAAKSVYTVPKSQRFQSQRTSRAASASTIATSGSDEQGLGEADEVTDLDKDRGTFVGEAFKNHLAELEAVFTLYLKNHDAANRRLQALQQNPKVEVWLKECRQWAADLTNAWDLDSLLVKPVQRLLKYPLLLTQLLEATPEDHPDRPAIKDAMHELTELSIRINAMKKHSELVESGLKKRNRKESDVRIGITKAIGRRTEKLKQNVGVSRVVEDKEYVEIRDRYAENLARLILVREDVKNYMNMARLSTHSVSDLAASVDGWIDVAHTAFPEKESKWRQYAMTIRELMTVAVPEHLQAIQQAVLDPMTATVKMLEALLKDSKGLIQKRDMKAMDYARYKNAKDRGEKLDKKISERMEEWEALNREAKSRMAKLIRLTSHLAQGCLKGFVQIQSTWLMIWQRKLEPVVGPSSPDLSRISREWQEDFDFHEAQAMTLGICNGSLLAEAVNLLNFATPTATLDGANSPRQTSWSGPDKRSVSWKSEASPSVSHDFSRHASGSFTTTASPVTESQDNLLYPGLAERRIATPTGSGPNSAAEAFRRRESMIAAAAAAGASIVRPSTSAEGRTDRSSGPPPSSSLPPRLSLEAPSPNLGTIRAPTSAPRPEIETFYSASSGIRLASPSPGPCSPPATSSLPRRSTTTAITGSSSGSSILDPNNNGVINHHNGHSHSAYHIPPPSATCDSLLFTTTGSTTANINRSNTVTYDPSPIPTLKSPSSGSGSGSGSGPGSGPATHNFTTADTLFLAASVYEFNIDRSRREAGFPYLTYVSGEIFDVIAERGELWLACNQDDPEKVVGWIWNKHFAKVGGGGGGGSGGGGR